nr:hypothetical protein [Tanacetum cinerariifolium]
FDCYWCCVVVGYREMDKGFLNHKTTSSKVVKNDLVVTRSVLGDLAGKVKSIDGKILGKYGKPMMAHRCISPPLTDDRSKLADQQVGLDPEAVNRLDLGPSNTMVNDTSCYTNIAPIELNNSSKVILPMAAIDEVNARFVNTLYGFPVGKKLAFLMVENYVKHAWAKFGLKRAMMQHGAFMFQFDSQIGMEKKERVSKVPLWVLMHNVPILAYSKVGLDLISAKVAEVPLVDSVDIDIPREDGKGYTTVTIRIEYEWQPPRCGTCKIYDHLESVCPMKPKAGPIKNSELKTDVMKDKQPVHSTGNNNKGKQVSTQRYIKGYRVNIPKTKLVYHVVVKPQAENNVACNLEQSSDTTKKPSPSDSSKEGKLTFVNNDISLAKLRSFVVKSANEESVLEYVGNNDINVCILREEKGDKISTMKTNSSMEVLNEDSDTDVDEVFLSNDGTTFPSSSSGGGQPLEEDDYDAYEDQFDDYPGLFRDFCDQFDFKVKAYVTGRDGRFHPHPLYFNDFLV